MVKKLTIIILVLFATPLGAQHSMQEGFDLLESGSYKKAELFFLDHLDSDNKTGRLCYARALGLGGKAEPALDSLFKLSIDYPTDLEVLLNLGEAYMWNNKPYEAVLVYSQLIEEYPNNFVANFGYANAHAALQKNDIALQYIKRAIDLDSENTAAKNSYKYIMISKAYKLYKNGRYKEALDWIGKIYNIEPDNRQAKEIENNIKNDSKCNLNIDYTQAQDKGGNHFRVKNLQFDFKLTDKHRLSFSGNLKNNFNSLDNGSARQQSFRLGDEIILNSKHKLYLGAGIASNLANESKVQNTLINAGLERFWSERLYSKLSFTSEAHDYTVDLIESNILMQHYSLASNFLLTKKIGLYINGVYTNQSDDNRRSLYYGSLYYSLSSAPLVRTGVNYNYFSYRSKRANYFSPEQYQLLEYFMLIDNMQTETPLKYKLQVSLGGQKISDAELQSIKRVECAVGYSFKSGIRLIAKYMSNSAATATALGAYSYEEWSLGINYGF